ncbi:hypothetical protein SELMODRAFT_235371 [Selaginella moellendorffii]|uniref:Peroxidase n=3 Tax=Selaginella moellendorffii TaxID=88036 RepID=D8SWQ9_SELML|nr:hypothetical protein SELMODRAFT_138810 [Selaginella moellendorffii]EFJ11137.1 hypothetical protein SELMODRAFT_235371 [Selaginella moellendorffii]
MGIAVLRPGFYKEKCPAAESIVKEVLQQAVEKDSRTAANILRLQFHDCFVLGCDASILLDDTHTFKGEKTANPNRNSARGFEVIDEIKAALEKECEGVVSCADVLAIAARDSVVLTGGPSWEVHLGRRDSLTASRSLANRDIPPPNSTLPQLIAAFAKKGLSIVDLVALTGSHTIGVSRCASFRQRLYNFAGTRRPDPSIDPALLRSLEHICPPKGNAQETTPLDIVTPTKFDNHFFVDLELHKGVLTSDQVLFAPYAPTSALVTAFAYDQAKFFQEFVASMVRMAAIKPLLGSEGQIRKECRFVNHKY